jgi:DNA primase
MAGYIPRDFIDQLIASIDLIDIIQERVQLKKAGKNFVACCPFHQEKSPSFNVSQDKQFYHCFGCGVSGNVISFLIDFDRMNFIEAIEFLAGRAGLEIPTDPNAKADKRQGSRIEDYQLFEQINKFYQHQLKNTPRAIDYLKARGINGEIAKHFGIGFAPDSWDSLLKEFHNPQKLFEIGMVIAKENSQGFYDRYRNRITFPIRNTRGQIIGFGGRVLDQSLPKYLNSPETHLFQKNQELYGWHEALQSSRKLVQIFVVEGYFDVISMAQAGITETVATLGTATSSEHIQKISRQCPQITFCFDGDKAGRDAAWRALMNALPVLKDDLQINFLFLPDGEDPDSFVLKQGAQAFREFAQRALPLSEYFFSHLTHDCNLQLAEGRAKLVKLAVPLIAKIPHNAIAQSLFDELAKNTKFDKSIIQRLLHDCLQKSEADFDLIAQKATNHHRIHLTPMRLAIALLIQNPKLAQTISPEKIHSLPHDFPGIDLLQKIFSICHENSNISTAVLLEHWRDQADFPQLLRLAAQEFDTPNDEILLSSWQDSLERIFEQVTQNTMSSLLEKMKTGNLSNEEKNQLLLLINRKIKDELKIDFN